MTLIHGFKLIQHQAIPELETEARLYRHEKTGAELLSLSNRDENKVFGITFRTPVSNSTGVAHILEHSVLCGSRKYPVKEPFVELLKGSLQTFLNAFTYPDRTCYPVASQNVKDFYNLVDVYLDAVFYPRLTPLVLQQEGWHYELTGREQPLRYQGVVFNEMKGAYSSPENLLALYSQQSLFPDTPYGFDSGGDPREIPSLSFEQFKAFHQTYYHPSNARIYFYGDDDIPGRLAKADEYLKDFAYRQLDTQVPLQPRFSKPRRITRPCPTGNDPAVHPKGMLTMNWLLVETVAIEINLALTVLEYLLLGMPASPLRKALIDSGLGEDLAGVGLDSDLRQIYLSTGLKGIDTSHADRVETLMLESLAGLVRDGIDPHTVEAALNTVEFRLRENNPGQFPRGLLLMLRALTTWLYGGDPLATVAFAAPLTALKNRLATNRRYFEQLIERFLLHNQHRTTLVLQPDPDLSERERAREHAALAAVRSSLSAAELDELIRNTRELQAKQAQPDSPQALATIPRLSLADIETQNRTIPLACIPDQPLPLLYHDLATNGILYFDLGFNLHQVPHTCLPYVPLFGRALLELGTEQEDFVTLVQRINRKTGGISTSLFNSATHDAGPSGSWLFLRGKALPEQTADLLAILADVLSGVRLDNRERFRQMVREEKAQLEQKLIPGGSQIVDMRLRAHFSEADWAEEQMKGVSYLFFLRALADAVERDWSAVLAHLEELRRRLINARAMIANVTLDGKHWAACERRVRDFLAALPAKPLQEQVWVPQRPAAHEALTIPARVNYVGKGMHLYSHGYTYHGSVQVIVGYLRTTWLWDRVRVQGGAYGARCHFDRFSGVLTFTSYRDPNLQMTLETFDQAADFLDTAHLSADELTRAIIGAIADIDRHLLPDAKGYTSLQRYLIGNTDALRQQMRTEIFATTGDHFKAFAGVLKTARNNGIVTVLGSEQAVADTLASRPGWLDVVKVL